MLSYNYVVVCYIKLHLCLLRYIYVICFVMLSYIYVVLYVILLY